MSALNLLRKRRGRAKLQCWSWWEAALARWEPSFSCLCFCCFCSPFLYCPGRCWTPLLIDLLSKRVPSSWGKSEKCHFYHFFNHLTTFTFTLIFHTDVDWYHPRCCPGAAWWRWLAWGGGHSCIWERAEHSQPLWLLAGWGAGIWLKCGAMLGFGNCIHIVQQVSALEEVSYYQLSREEEKVNDNMIKLTRAVNQDLTPTIWNDQSGLEEVSGKSVDFLENIFPAPDLEICFD